MAATEVPTKTRRKAHVDWRRLHAEPELLPAFLADLGARVSAVAAVMDEKDDGVRLCPLCGDTVVSRVNFVEHLHGRHALYGYWEGTHDRIKADWRIGRRKGARQ